MPRPLLLVAAAFPLVLWAMSALEPEPAFGVSCGGGHKGKPREVILHAGLESARQIHAQIREIPPDPATPDDPQMRIEVAAGGNSSSCWSDSPGVFHVYLNSRSASEVSMAVHSAQPVILRGVRNGREQSSVTIEPAGPVAATLTW